ncbi:unnamed protein product [Chilo suppressalis]|uniref:Uncharacterized protein n=1 Tax=Chilo suppressalis TaxID=168631 RepID=A0ABN8AVY3_CHISP|nr:unnamed protein product [Chilo suppressalis]
MNLAIILSKVKLPAMFRLDKNGKLDLVLNCYDGSRLNGCEFFTKYMSEEWVTPLTLSAGRMYFAELVATFEKDINDEKLLVGTCVSDAGYSQRQCFVSKNIKFLC